MLLLILLRKLCGNVQYYQSTKKVQATLDAEVKNKTKKAAKLKFDRKNLYSYVPASHKLSKYHQPRERNVCENLNMETYGLFRNQMCRLCRYALQSALCWTRKLSPREGNLFAFSQGSKPSHLGSMNLLCLQTKSKAIQWAAITTAFVGVDVQRATRKRGHRFTLGFEQNLSRFAQNI